MEKDYRKNTWTSGSLALLCISFAAITLGISDIKSWKHPTGQVATISVAGEGDVTALPDIATVTTTVRESAKTVPEAQKAVETKMTQALASISSIGVDKKDIKTISYTVNPKYDTQTVYCIMAPCPPIKNVIVGYEVAETVQIKVRKIDSAGDVIGALGKANITEISGPEFTVENMDTAKAKAKEIAIKNAKDKAMATAKALGVSLGDITQFNEDNGGNYPVMYGAMKASSDSVTLPQGESVIKSNVTITYSLN